MGSIRRPTSVTVFASLIIAVALVRLLTIPLMLFVGPARQVIEDLGGVVGAAAAVGLARACISSTCAVAMLRRKNWARVLYFAAVPAGVLADLWAYRFAYHRLIAVHVDIAMYAVIVYYLTRPDAVAYFRSSPAAQLTDSQAETPDN